MAVIPGENLLWFFHLPPGAPRTYEQPWTRCLMKTTVRCLCPITSMIIHTHTHITPPDSSPFFSPKKEKTEVMTSPEVPCHDCSLIPQVLKSCKPGLQSCGSHWADPPRCGVSAAPAGNRECHPRRGLVITSPKPHLQITARVDSWYQRWGYKVTSYTGQWKTTKYIAIYCSSGIQSTIQQHPVIRVDCLR